MKLAHRPPKPWEWRHEYSKTGTANSPEHLCVARRRALQ